MPELRLAPDETRSRVDVLITWMLRIGVAATFASVGSSKFGAHSSWIGLFEQIGFGQWFRYLTGAIQVTGAVLVIVPRTFLLGIAVLSCTMAGALAAWIFLLHAPGNAVIPAVILVGLVAIGFQGRTDAVLSSADRR